MPPYTGDVKIFDPYFTDAFFTFKGMSVNKIRSCIRKAFHFKGFDRFLKIDSTCPTNMLDRSRSAFSITDLVSCFALWNQALTSIYSPFQRVFCLPSNTFCSLMTFSLNRSLPLRILGNNDQVVAPGNPGDEKNRRLHNLANSLLTI